MPLVAVHPGPHGDNDKLSRSEGPVKWNGAESTLRPLRQGQSRSDWGEANSAPLLVRALPRRVLPTAVRRKEFELSRTGRGITARSG
jgi:hypothetical protein